MAKQHAELDPNTEQNNSADEVTTKHETDSKHQAKLATRYHPLKSYWNKTLNWLKVRRNQYKVLGVSFALLFFVLLIPPLRYGLLNSIGIRGSLIVTVHDDSTDLPLKNVLVEIGDKNAKTDRYGKATLNSVKLGKQVLHIEKLAYATLEKDITITAGETDVGVASLSPVGIQFEVSVKDWLSAIAISGAEVASGSNSVVSDSAGLATLTVPPTDSELLPITITADNYRTETVSLSTSQEDTLEVELVVDRSHFYISKHSGKYDLFRVDPDGQNKEKILAGTGQENSNIQLMEMAESRAVFLVNSREGNRNEDGSILYGLFQVDSATNEVEKIDESESIRLYGKTSDRLIYMKVAAGASGTNPNRQRLISYNPVSGDSVELAASNYFNSVAVTADAVFFAPSDLYKDNRMPYLYRSNPITGTRTTVHGDTVWTIYRSTPDELIFDAQQDWYKVSTSEGASVVPLDNRPTNLTTRLFTQSPSGDLFAYVDFRDGKGYLIVGEGDDEDEVVHFEGGLKHPLRWLSENHLVYRVSNNSGTADYVIDRRGGEPSEISSVSDISGFDRWYYYY